MNSDDINAGALRDAVGSIRNLAQLLESVRVGPKAIAKVLPAVLEVCDPLIAATEQLTTRWAPVCGTEGPEALRAFVVPSVVRLKAALSQGGVINAKRRLELERQLHTAADELGAALTLVDLLDEVVTHPPRVIDIAELIRQARAGDQPAPTHSTAIRAGLEGASDSLELTVNPRVLMSLLGLVVATVARDDGPILIHIEAQPRRLTVRHGVATGAASIEVWAPRSIEPTLPCARAAAAALGAKLIIGDTLEDARLEWPPAGTAPP